MSCGETLYRRMPFSILAATLTGMSADQFQVDVKDWIKTAREPCWQHPYTAARNPEDEDLGKTLRSFRGDTL